MIAGIHQPQYLPWLGYFHKIAVSDVFILLDDVQFKKNEWQNRNRIRTPQGWQWLTVPVLHDFGQKISEVQINNRIPWREAHLKALCLNYKKAPFFEACIPHFEDIYARDWQRLGELNIFIVRKLVGLLGIATPLLISSDLGVAAANTQRLIQLCRKAGADTYLSGVDGKNYMDLDLCLSSGISVTVQEFRHPQYPQLWAGKNNQEFLSHMSIIDLLFNCGPESLSQILQGVKEQAPPR
jgi:hypothetical protein